MAGLLTQTEILEDLNKRGYVVSRRTLRYWRSEGLLPLLFRDNERCGYPIGVIQDIEKLCNKKGRIEPEILFIHLDQFPVYHLDILRQHGKVKYIYHTKDSVIVEDRGEYYNDYK